MGKTRKKKMPGFLKLILTVLFAACVIVIVASLPVWQIKAVIIEGNKIVPEKEILDKASISYDENIFFVNYREVTRRIKEIPQIKDVRAAGQLLNKVSIRIEERKPFAVVIFSGDYVVVDDEGVIMAHLKAGEPGSFPNISATELPTVVGLPKEAIAEGKRVRPGTMRIIENSFKLLGRLLGKAKFEIEMSKSDEMSIIIDDTLKVKIGDTEDIENKLGVLSHLLKANAGRRDKIDYIDVRLIDVPVVKIAK